MSAAQMPFVPSEADTRWRNTHGLFYFLFALLLGMLVICGFVGLGLYLIFTGGPYLLANASWMPYAIIAGVVLACTGFIVISHVVATRYRTKIGASP